MDDNIIIDGKLRWGWFKFRPNFLQKFLKPQWALFFACLGTFFQGFSCNGLLQINLPEIEYKFNLKSRESGIICGSYNIASILFLLPVTYFGSQSNASKPKWYGSGMILMGLGSLTFVIPEIIIGTRTSSSTYKTPPLCNFTSPVKLSDVCGNETERKSTVFWIFLTGNLLNGAGGCILYTLAVTYIEEGVSTAKSATFLGIFYITAIVGSASGFVIGGFFLQLNNEYFFGKSENLLRNNFCMVSENSVEIKWNEFDNNNETHGGVWWLGFFMSGFMLLLVAIPNLGFPAELPGTQNIKQSKISEAHYNTLALSEDYVSKENISKQLCNVLKNPTFAFLTFAGSLDSAILHSTSIFMPKILENQFHASEKLVSIIMGIAVIFGGVFGVIAGGLVITYYELNFNRTIKVCITTSLCGSICTISFLLHCKEVAFAGVNTSYNNSIRSLQNDCNNKCSCHEEIYKPVCGVDGLTYYSPCFAGCQEFKEKVGYHEFYNCTCMTLKSDPFSSEPDGVSNQCTVHCPVLIYFAICAALSIFFIFLALVPGVSATLRCVHTSQKPLAVGMQWLMIRLFGVFSPVLLGAVLDLSCSKWRSTCAEEGACVLYNNKGFSWRSFLLGLSLKLGGFISLYLSLHTYKPVTEI